jgi:hypothetical protein
MIDPLMTVVMAEAYNLETLKSFWVRIGCLTLEHTSVMRRRPCSIGTLEVVEIHTKEIGIP